MKIKTVLTIIFIAIAFLSSYILYEKNKILEEDLNYTMVNMKAFDLENSKLKDKNLVYQLTIDQLNYLNDSLIVKLNETRKELNVKDKNIQRLEYLSSTITRTDTLFIRDTIFKDPTFKVDTSIKDKWYSLDLTMYYPNKIQVSPTFKSETYIITHWKKETLYPPKKCAIARWFQRKQKVLEVEVVEKNPYINSESKKFVEIIK